MATDHTITLWDYSTGAVSVAGATGRLHGNVLGRLWRRLKRRLRVWDARNDLGTMPDDVLRDLGLSRSELDYIAELVTQDID